MRYFISQPLVGNNVNGTVGEGTVSGEMALASPARIGSKKLQAGAGVADSNG